MSSPSSRMCETSRPEEKLQDRARARALHSPIYAWRGQVVKSFLLKRFVRAPERTLRDTKVFTDRRVRSRMGLHNCSTEANHQMPGPNRSTRLTRELSCIRHPTQRCDMHMIEESKLRPSTRDHSRRFSFS